MTERTYVVCLELVDVSVEFNKLVPDITHMFCQLTV